MEITGKEIQELMKDLSLMPEFTRKFNSLTSSNANEADLLFAIENVEIDIYINRANRGCHVVTPEYKLLKEIKCKEWFPEDFLFDILVIYRKSIFREMNNHTLNVSDQSIVRLFLKNQREMKKILEMKPDLAAGSRTKAARQ